MLQVANSLRFGALVFYTMDTKDPPHRLIYEASDHFIDRAQRLLLNVTGGLRYTERLVALLAQNEFLRISAFDLLADFTPRDPVVIFGGAHYGAVLSSVLAALPKGKAYAFEADPFTFRVLNTVYESHP